MRISDWSSDVCSSDLSARRVRDAVALLDERPVDFEYDGDISADVALDPELMKRLYPFCRLSGPANVLIMPALHSANIAAKLLQKLGGGTVIGPMLIGLPKSVQIVQMGRSEERRVGKECVSPCRSRGWPDRSKKKNKRK